MFWALLVCWGTAWADPAVVFESGASRPLALSEDGAALWVANLPDGRLDRLDLDTDPPALVASVAVGLDPVAVAIDGDRAWVVNEVSDSVSVIDLAATPPVVTHTLPVGDDPGDVVIASGKVFVTAAQRGQALAAVDLQPEVPGLPRADVWIFDATDPAAPPQRLSLLGDTPRALAVSPDGGTVYVAVFRSGNGTTTVPEPLVCDGGATAMPCTVDGVTLPGGLPAPNVDAADVPGPETGLIVRHDGAAWRDERGWDWSPGVRLELPDHDVFALDATGATVVETARYSGVGTVLFSMAVDADGAVWVANTEALNEVRFVGDPGGARTSVRGHMHETRLTRIADGVVTPIDLNPHVDPTATSQDAPQTLAQPTAVAVHGDQVWVTGYGTGALVALNRAELAAGVVDTAEDRLILTAGGPSGLLSDPTRDRMYVYARFDQTVDAIDAVTGDLLWRVPLHSPEDVEVMVGRAIFFDAKDYGNGANSCGSCHVFGHDDGLAWDLGNPDEVVQPNPNPVIGAPPAGISFDYHPLKGPMITQTLRGMADNGALHWRGDHTGGATPSTPGDPWLGVLEFAPAFDDMLGEDVADLPAVELVADWAIRVRARPNPWLPLDEVRTPAQQAAWDQFTTDCTGCHVLDAAAGHWGTDGSVAANAGGTQVLKVPSLRNAYDKLGLYAAGGNPLGPQVRGFGWFHDGATGAIADGLLAAILAFPSDFAPIVGQQLTLRGEASDDLARRDLLVDRATTGSCDLVAHHGDRGWLLSDGVWVADDPSAPSADLDALLATTAPLTLLCAPPGLGERIALDRDFDGLYNAADNCPAVENPDQSDADADGTGDACAPPDAPDPGDTGGSGTPVPHDTAVDASPAPARTLPPGGAGCGCSSGARPGAWVWLATLALGFRRRRR